MHLIKIMIREILAKNIKKYRKRSGLTQNRFAELCGVSASLVAHIETKGCNASIAFLEKACTVLKIAPGQLFE
ncbi:helix-turn-helix transcriptional regulator [Treponema sp. OMZ 840]|uniref:helix-turn-helix domain-containing protein n=1 Tax=Treponema sp. OMZ 840 TaxID=244313 RepID=UPI003D8A708A